MKYIDNYIDIENKKHDSFKEVALDFNENYFEFEETF